MSNLYLELSRIAKTVPEKIAIVEYDGNSCTYAKLIEEIDSSADYLFRVVKAHHFSTVGLLCADSIETIELIFAFSKIGLSAVTINASLRENQISTILIKSGTTWIISDSERFSTDFLFVERFEGFFLYKLSSGENSTYALQSSVLNPFLITASSGSTGDPKPIVFSQELKIARSAQSRDLYGVTQDDVILNASPFSHSLGQRLTFLPLLTGAKLVLLRKFSPLDWVDAVQEYRVSFTICVSSHLHGLTGYLLSPNFILDSLRCLVSSSAALNSTVKKELFQSKNFDFHEQYGASEVATVTNASTEIFNQASESVGVTSDDVSVQIIDASGNRCAPGISGEIYVKTPLICEGYVADGRIVPATNSSGWFATSDLGFSDSKGRLFFLGRIKDVIGVGGQNLFPGDVERVIYEFEEIMECCVVGKDDDYFGQVPVAYLAGSIHSMELLSRIREKIGTKLAPYQQPFHYIWLSKLPKLQSGKIDKVTLRENANNFLRNDGRRVIHQSRNSVE